MAKKTITELVDDLDGSPATSTVSFALSGDRYELDLSDTNAARLDDALAPFVAAARRTSRTRSTRATAPGLTRAVGGRGNLDEIRSWARANGHQVADRGRIAASVTAAYDAAH